MGERDIPLSNVSLSLQEIKSDKNHDNLNRGGGGGEAAYELGVLGWVCMGGLEAWSHREF